MECSYNIYFRNHRKGHRIISVPILKDTCSCCEDREYCKVSIFNNNIKQDDLDKELKYDLKQYERYLQKCMDLYKQIEGDILKGKYVDKYKCELLRLSDAPPTAIIYDVNLENSYGKKCGKITVKEYLEKYPDECDKKRIVGVKKISKVSDVVYGLNKGEIEDDLKYVREALKEL